MKIGRHRNYRLAFYIYIIDKYIQVYVDLHNGTPNSKQQKTISQYDSRRKLNIESNKTLMMSFKYAILANLS